MTELRRDCCTFNQHEDTVNYILGIFEKNHNLCATTIEQNNKNGNTDAKQKTQCKSRQPKVTRQVVWMI